MKKSDAEPAVRQLVHQWADLQSAQDLGHPSFIDFLAWMRADGYGAYASFRSTMGPREDMERWFDQELRQTWRN